MKDGARKNWSVSIDFIVETVIKNHPNPFLFIEEDDFKGLFGRLKELSVRRNDSSMFFEIMKALNHLRDSHTRLRGFREVSSPVVYPFELTHFTDGFYITALQKDCSQFLGHRITSLNGLDIDEVLKKAREYLPNENEVVFRNSFSNWVVEPDFLQHLGVIDSERELSLGIEGGGGFNMLPSEGFDLVFPMKTSGRRYKSSSVQKNQKNLSTKYFLKDSTLYVEYRECDGVDKKEIVDLISKVSTLKVKNVIVDLRENTGGSSLILDPFIEFLDSEDKYKVFVLVSRHTYSAAIINALSLTDIEGSVSIGEETSGAPTKFGETRSFNLPSFKKLQLIVSTKEFVEEGYEYGVPFVPDIHLDISIEDYMSGVDPVLEKALELVR